MCGITGFLSSASVEGGGALAKVMSDVIAHRGPDGDGFWIDDDRRVHLGHRRLAIIDLSEAGAQPMVSASGRYVICYNGEVYGFQALRERLEAKGASFRGHSDTEVMLAAFEAFGFEDAMAELNGMFAFALYDRKERRLSFARDRLGKKPLYIGLNDGVLAFGSELKCLRAHPAFTDPTVDREALALLMRHNYVPGPRSIYREVFKLPPASVLTIDIDAMPTDIGALREAARPYWRAYDSILAGMETTIADEAVALDHVEDVLTQAVRERMVSDVPIGAFLSGGIDSTLICALMQEAATGPVQTYTVRFDDARFNEADAALAIADHLGTEHTELTATGAMALELVGDMPQVYDEPFADSSQLPTFLVSKLARRNVTVALSGDGGDESFGGYSRYFQMLAFQRLGNRVPRPVLKAMAHTPVGMLDFAAKIGRPLLPASFRAAASGDRLRKAAELLSDNDFLQVYLNFISQWRDPGDLVLGAEEPPSAVVADRWRKVEGDFERLMAIDTMTYLPDDILVKVDRASMAVSLEMRAPLLDYRVVEAAWRMPRSLRYGGGLGKLVLRRLVDKRVPPGMMDRPKQGFGIPINDWLRGPLAEWSGDLLSRERLARDGYFNVDMVQRRFEEHRSGKREWGRHLWTVLMFNAWHDAWH